MEVMGSDDLHRFPEWSHDVNQSGLGGIVMQSQAEHTTQNVFVDKSARNHN